MFWKWKKMVLKKETSLFIVQIAYWYNGISDFLDNLRTVPSFVPSCDRVLFLSLLTPIILNLLRYMCFLQSAPPQISARGRSDDLSTIISVIDDAQKFIYISVMDYLPLSQFTEPLRWPATQLTETHQYLLLLCYNPSCPSSDTNRFPQNNVLNLSMMTYVITYCYLIRYGYYSNK